MAERLKTSRLTAGLTQTELATSAGVTATTICHIENGRRGFGASVIDIASALGVSIDYLLYGSPNHKAHPAKVSNNSNATPQAQELAQLFDLLTDRIIRAKAFAEASQCIIKHLEQKQ